MWQEEVPRAPGDERRGGGSAHTCTPCRDSCTRRCFWAPPALCWTRWAVPAWGVEAPGASWLEVRRGSRRTARCPCGFASHRLTRPRWLSGTCCVCISGTHSVYFWHTQGVFLALLSPSVFASSLWLLPSPWGRPPRSAAPASSLSECGLASPRSAYVPALVVHNLKNYIGSTVILKCRLLVDSPVHES